MKRDGWEVKKLGEVCVRKQDVVRANVCFDEKDVINYIDISSIDNIRHLVAETKEFCFVDAPSRAQQVVKEDDIIVSLVRPNLKNIAKLVGIPKNSIASTGFCVLRTRDCVISNYIKYCVLSEHFTNYLISRTSGINYPAVKEDDIKNYSLFVPSISEQSRIVEELDLLSNIIEKKRQQLSELDNLAQSIFYDMFGDPVTNEKGWKVKKLGDISYIGLGFTHTPEYVDEGVPFLSVKDISKGEICWDNIKHVSKEEYDSAPKGAKPKKGDIMFCRVGTMGKPVIVKTDQPFCTFVSVGYIHLLNDNVINVYVKYWMLSYAFELQVESNVKGLAIKNLNTGWLKTFDIQIPPLPLQQLFAKKIEAIEKQKALIKQSIAETEELFNSRMDYYFS